MKHCKDHSVVVADESFALYVAQLQLDNLGRETVAAGIVALDSRPICCPKSGYARSLMKAAFRELLQGE